MASDRVTIRLSKALGQRLQGRCRKSGKNPSDILRVALENYLGNDDGSASAFDVAKAAGLIGCARGLPKDLSTNRRYMDGFGREK